MSPSHWYLRTEPGARGVSSNSIGWGIGAAVNMLSNKLSVLSRLRSNCVNPAPGLTIVGTDSSKPKYCQLCSSDIAGLCNTHILVRSWHNPPFRCLVSYSSAHEHRLVDFEHIHILFLDDCTFRMSDCNSSQETARWSTYTRTWLFPVTSNPRRTTLQHC